MLEQLRLLLRAVRERLGVSQARLAKDIGESLDRVKKIELGRTRPDVEYLANLRAGHGVSIDKLIDRSRRK